MWKLRNFKSLLLVVDPSFSAFVESGLVWEVVVSLCSSGGSFTSSLPYVLSGNSRTGINETVTGFGLYIFEILKLPYRPFLRRPLFITSHC